MDNMVGFREEEVGSRRGDSLNPGIAHMDTILGPIRDYVLPPSVTPPMRRRPTIQANNFELKPITLQLLQGI